jgi:hypothetical protein
MASANPKWTEELMKRRGARAQFWFYSPTLSTFVLRLQFTGKPGNLHVVCSPLEWIQGPCYWRDVEIEIEEVAESYVVRDRKSGFEARCFGVALQKDVEPVYYRDDK